MQRAEQRRAHGHRSRGIALRPASPRTVTDSDELALPPLVDQVIGRQRQRLSEPEPGLAQQLDQHPVTVGGACLRQPLHLCSGQHIRHQVRLRHPRAGNVHRLHEQLVSSRPARELTDGAKVAGDMSVDVDVPCPDQSRCRPLPPPVIHRPPRWWPPRPSEIQSDTGIATRAAHIHAFCREIADIRPYLTRLRPRFGFALPSPSSRR
jgi:hypothetical protein